MINQTPFSVSMCVYGGDNAEHFKLAVDSILHQSIQPNEVVLVVDGPVPRHLDAVISEYEQLPCFKVIRLKENRGHGIARRTCLSNCSYNIVALMDADDISVPRRFEKELDVLLNHDNLSIVGGDIAEFIDRPENIVGYRKVPSEDKEIKEYLKKRCPMNQMTVMFRKGDVESVGGYLDWYCEEDYYLWIRMALANMKFANVSDVLVNVRVGKEMYQRRGGWKYFKSEAWLQRFMLKNRIIGPIRCGINLGKRALVQLLLPGSIRRWVFRRFARKAGTEWTDRVKQ
jgi:glycosyltransferase involved in cell wall biosynthesis